MSQVGDYCRKNKDIILGCSGDGRPTCQAVECIYGAEPCPNPSCRGFRAESLTPQCASCGEKGEASDYSPQVRPS